MTLAPARTCDVCGRWPCACRIEPPFLVYIEPTFRVERCSCGGSIPVYEPTDRNITAAVTSHNGTVGHSVWRGRWS